MQSQTKITIKYFLENEFNPNGPQEHKHFRKIYRKLISIWED